jgi:putative adenylate-forming enzyme
MNFLIGLNQGIYWGLKGGRFKNRDHLNQWKKRQFHRQFEYLKQRVAFYDAYEDLEHFPLINKQVVSDNFGRINTAGISLTKAIEVASKAEADRDFSPMIGKYTVGLSTGTSGKRGLFVVSPYERGFWAGYILRRMLPRGILHAERVALFLRAGSNLYSSISRGPVRFQYFDLKESLASLLANLQKFKPTVLAAPPSMLAVIADQKDFLSILPRRIISIADVLDPMDQARLETAFGQPIHQIYQATEGLLGLTCDRGQLHLCEDLVHFEWEELGQGRVTPIITDLRRRSVPLVRYRLNDMLRLSEEPCSCGCPFAVARQIEGRMDHLLVGRSQDGSDLIPVFPDDVRTMLGALFDSHSIRSEYSVRQTTPTSLIIALENGICDESLRTDMHKELSNLFTSRGCQLPDIGFGHLEGMDLTMKRQRVIRLFESQYNVQQ